MSGKVSVIIPCYNGENVIDRSIQSVYEQDYPNIELIVVDDGSTDGSKERILAWSSKFEQKGFVLKYIFQENQGPGAAINCGLKYIEGEYLTLLDADDRYLPGSIRKRAEYLNSHPDFGVVRSNGWMVSNESRTLFVQMQQEKEDINLFDALVFGKTNNWAGTYMVRTSVLFSAYPNRSIFPSKYGQNIQILLPVAYKRKCGFIDEPLMEYIVQPNSHSQATTNRFEKEEKNAYGYREIYLDTLNKVLEDEEELQKYTNAFEASFYRCAMQRAISHNKVALSKEYFKKLYRTGLSKTSDKIQYYTFSKSPKAYLYRALRKIEIATKRRDR